MAGSRNALDASGVSVEDSAANEESFYSGDEALSHSENDAVEDPAKHDQTDEMFNKSLAKGLADCSITPEKRAARQSGADLDQSEPDEEMAEVASKKKQAKEPGEKVAPGRPKYPEMILEAMVSAGPSRSGVSVHQIKKLVHQKNPDLANKNDIYFRNGLKRLVDSEKLVQVTGTGASGSFKLVKPDKTKTAPMSKAPAVRTKTASKAGPKSVVVAATTTKSVEAKKYSSSKSPMKSSGKSTKAAVAKASVATIKPATVRLTKMSNGFKSKIATSNAPLKSLAVARTAKPRGRPAKPTESAALKSSASGTEVAESQSSVPSKGRTDSAKSPAKSKSVPKSPKLKSVVPKSPKLKSVVPKSPKLKSVPKSLKSKSVAPKSPKPKSVPPKSPSPRMTASKAKLDSASDDAEKTAPGPASKRGKK